MGARPKIAVVLSGCGHLDGAEIRESVLTLLALDRAGAKVEIFAPDILQREVIDHLTGERMSEMRNVLVEAARIARGDIQPLDEMHSETFDALVIPGGFGVAKNLSSLAIDGPKLSILPDFKRLILEFLHAKKPIGAICIAPAVLVAAVRDEIKATVTIGKDKDKLISALGGVNQSCAAGECAYDAAHRIASCPAYMTDEPIAEIARGIEQVVEKVIALCRTPA